MHFRRPDFSNVLVIRHEVSDAVKKQAEADSTKNKIYSIIDLKKGGSLIELMRDANRRRDFAGVSFFLTILGMSWGLFGVDEQIKEIVRPFLYNDGEGKEIPVEKLVRMRNSERPPSKALPTSGLSDVDPDSEQTASNDHLGGRLARIKQNCFKQNKVSTSSEASGTSVPVKVLTRTCCWKISERGTLGETALHVCLLLATVIHLDLARRLVRLFPKLANDIYLGDEYYGESALHMAVVNEDLMLVKFLVDQGADVHERCLGNFFCADDQKENRFDSLDQENYKLPLETNYAGHAYWGEYPLSMAACLELEDCFRLLLAKNADPDRQDNNGNTVLHMLVVVDKLYMFDLAYELGASLTIKNSQGLTPLSLAAKLTRTEMFFHILKLQRDVFWQFCDIAFAAYPLDELDSIDVTTGEVEQTSALTVTAFGDELGHLDLMEGCLVEILQQKWNTFAKKRFFSKIKIFSVYFALTFVVFWLRPSPEVPPDSIQDQHPSGHCPGFPVPSKPSLKLVPTNLTESSLSCLNDTCSLNVTLQNMTKLETSKLSANATYSNRTSKVKVFDRCYLLKLDTNIKKIRGTFEVFTLIGSVAYILSMLLEMNRLGLKTFCQTWASVPGRVMFLASCCLVLLALPFRLTCRPRVEDRIIAAAMFLTPMHFLFFCRGFKAVGPFVVMIYKMIISDLLCFVLIYMIFVFGFAEAFFVIFRSHRGSGTNYFSGVIDSVMSMFLMSLNEFGDIYAEFDHTDHPYLAKFLFLIYMMLVSVLLVNMLIAMMGKTYQDIASRPNEWLRQWARIVLIVERGLSREERHDYQKKYAEERNHSRVFIIRWETTDEEKAEIDELKELKNENVANQRKRRSGLKFRK